MKSMVYEYAPPFYARVSSGVRDVRACHSHVRVYAWAGTWGRVLVAGGEKHFRTALILNHISIYPSLPPNR